MKQLHLIALLLALWITPSFAQTVDSNQVTVAKKFLELLRKGDAESCWTLFDQSMSPDLSKQQFMDGIMQLKSNLSDFDSFALTMSGFKMNDDKTFSFHTFKAISTNKNIVDDIAVDIIFQKGSQLVAGVQPKTLVKENAASTSKGKETPLENSFQAEINGVSYNIKGINIVHFEKGQGLLAIQVEYKLPDDPAKMDAFVKKEAVKFAQYLVKNGYIQKAKDKAKELNRTMLDDIGVSLFDVNKGGGYNVMLKPEEYK